MTTKVSMRLAALKFRELDVCRQADIASVRAVNFDNVSARQVFAPVDEIGHSGCFLSCFVHEGLTGDESCFPTIRHRKSSHRARFTKIRNDIYSRFSQAEAFCAWMTPLFSSGENIMDTLQDVLAGLAMMSAIIAAGIWFSVLT